MDRRKLRLERLEDAVNECERLLRDGYQRNGKWTLGQICYHLRTTQDASVNGFPKWMSFFAPIRPLFRALLLSRVLGGDSPSGLRTAAKFIPPTELSDRDEVDAFAMSVKQFRQHTGLLHAHPGFGRFDHDEYEKLHLAHAAHHLGFLASMQEVGRQS